MASDPGSAGDRGGTGDREPAVTDRVPARTDAAAVSLGGPLAAARLLERPNRFLVRCRREDEEGEVVEAHMPNPGRMEDLLVPGRRLRLRPAEGEHRKTSWTAARVERADGGGWVSLDTTLPNRLVEIALRAGSLEELAGWSLEGREVALGDSRLDFVLSSEDGRRLALEVKSVSLVAGREGRFPDAVTARGARHLRKLAALARRDDWEAAVLFVAQRADVDRVVAARDIDPGFADALAAARGAGVRAYARRCRVSPGEVRLGRRVPAGPADGG